MSTDVVNLNKYSLNFETLGDITTQIDRDGGISQYIGQCRIEEVLNISTDGNVRGFLAQDTTRRLTNVHKGIKQTLESCSELFPVYNGGLTIIADSAEVNWEMSTLNLENCTVVDGAQTLGMFIRFLDQCAKDDIDPGIIYVKFELMVTKDKSVAINTAIYRNTRNDVDKMSIVAKKGVLDDLAKSIFDDLGLVVQGSQSERGKGIPADKLLQVITCMIPDNLWIYSTNRRGGNVVDRSRSYNGKTRVLEDFSALHGAIFSDQPTPCGASLKACKDLYTFMVDFAPVAWETYQYWRNHQGFLLLGVRNGLSINSVGVITAVNDGIVFPVLGSLSQFIAKNKEGDWTISYPDGFDEENLIKSVKRLFVTESLSNPNKMGREKRAYFTLEELTRAYVNSNTRTKAIKSKNMELALV